MWLRLGQQMGEQTLGRDILEDFLSTAEQITTNDLRKISRYFSELEMLSVGSISCSALDFLNFLNSLPNLKIIEFKGTQIPSAVLKIARFKKVIFNGYDFAKINMELPENIEELDIVKCKNISRFKRLSEFSGKLSISCSNVRGLSFKFPNLKHLLLGRCGIQKLDKIAIGCPELVSLILFDNPIVSLDVYKFFGEISIFKIPFRFKKLEYFSITASKKFSRLGNVR